MSLPRLSYFQYNIFAVEADLSSTSRNDLRIALPGRSCYAMNDEDSKGHSKTR